MMQAAKPVDGRKDDGGKDNWALVPWRALAAVVRVLTFGGNKYGNDNWQRVSNPRERYFAAAMRHLYAWRMGDQFDQDSEEPHLAHAACCLLFLLSFDHSHDPKLENEP